jgi:GAF domain-containing protein
MNSGRRAPHAAVAASVARVERLNPAMADVERAIRRGDPSHALCLLNERTRYRFTGLYRFEPPLLRSVLLFDRENPDVCTSGEASPLDDTFCSILFATSCPFTTDDAPTDERLETHAARYRVLSYTGVPVLRHGKPFGTLCHFDGRPRLLPMGELAFLQSVSGLFEPMLTE